MDDRVSLLFSKSPNFFFCFLIDLFKTIIFFYGELPALQLFLMILWSFDPPVSIYHTVKALLATAHVRDQLWLRPTFIKPRLNCNLNVSDRSHKQPGPPLALPNWTFPLRTRKRPLRQHWNETAHYANGSLIKYLGVNLIKKIGRGV